MVTCDGVGIGPTVTLSCTSINFNDVEIGNEVSRAFSIQNHSSVPAFYEFLCEANSTFRIDKPWGTLNPNSTIALTAKFSPVEPMNYYRRTYILIENQGALYMDFLGTGYNDVRRPATFSLDHVIKYQNRIRRRLNLFAPEQLENMLKNGVLESRNDLLEWAKSPPADLEPGNIADPVTNEYFHDGLESFREVTALDTYVDFGASATTRANEPRVVRLMNHTQGKVTCFWVHPGESTGEECEFEVFPQSADIAPKSVAEFKVYFHPSHESHFYGVQLEAFVYFKSMRNFRLVSEDTFTPPWCVTVTVAGHTFPSGEETFIPKIQFPAARLDFPTCLVDGAVYRTARVTNSGDTPAKFAFPRDLAVFQTKPKNGILGKNQSRLIVFKFAPLEVKQYEEPLSCIFNDSASNQHVAIADFRYTD